MKQADQDRGLAGRRVLVVEDEYFLAYDMAGALLTLGADVVGPLPTRDAVLEFLASNEAIDVAVLDIHLRGQTVFPVADALMARGVPFVFTTGYGHSAVPSAYQATPRWEKPFNPNDLARALPGLLQGASA